MRKLTMSIRCTGTRVTISDKYAISGNGNLVENNMVFSTRLALPEIAYLSEIVIRVPVFDVANQFNCLNFKFNSRSVTVHVIYLI